MREVGRMKSPYTDSLRAFWCTGYYVSTVGNNKSAVYRYVENQLKEDMMSDQLKIKEYKDPFKGGK